MGLCFVACDVMQTYTVVVIEDHRAITHFFPPVFRGFIDFICLYMKKIYCIYEEPKAYQK